MRIPWAALTRNLRDADFRPWEKYENKSYIKNLSGVFGRLPDRMPEDMLNKVPKDMPNKMSEDLSNRIPENMSNYMPEDIPDKMSNRMSEDMSDRMPEDLPIRKYINVMLGIIQNKII